MPTRMLAPLLLAATLASPGGGERIPFQETKVERAAEKIPARK